MAIRAYPDDREVNPVQLTLSEFVEEAVPYYTASQNGNRDNELKFLKFTLAGRRGLDLNDQRSITLNPIQGLRNIDQITASRDYDSLIGTTKTLPYRVPLTVWPVLHSGIHSSPITMSHPLLSTTRFVYSLINTP
jgi:hypothetical protein